MTMLDKALRARKLKHRSIKEDDNDVDLATKIRRWLISERFIFNGTDYEAPTNFLEENTFEAFKKDIDLSKSWQKVSGVNKDGPYTPVLSFTVECHITRSGKEGYIAVEEEGARFKLKYDSDLPLKVWVVGKVDGEEKNKLKFYRIRILGDKVFDELKKEWYEFKNNLSANLKRIRDDITEAKNNPLIAETIRTRKVLEDNGFVPAGFYKDKNVYQADFPLSGLEDNPDALVKDVFLRCTAFTAANVYANEQEVIERPLSSTIEIHLISPSVKGSMQQVFGTPLRLNQIIDSSSYDPHEWEQVKDNVINMIYKGELQRITNVDQVMPAINKVVKRLNDFFSPEEEATFGD